MKPALASTKTRVNNSCRLRTLAGVNTYEVTQIPDKSISENMSAQYMASIPNNVAAVHSIIPEEKVELSSLKVYITPGSYVISTLIAHNKNDLCLTRSCLLFNHTK